MSNIIKQSNSSAYRWWQRGGRAAVVACLFLMLAACGEDPGRADVFLEAPLTADEGQSSGADFILLLVELADFAGEREADEELEIKEHFSAVSSSDAGSGGEQWDTGRWQKSGNFHSNPSPDPAPESDPPDRCARRMPEGPGQMGYDCGALVFFSRASISTVSPDPAPEVPGQSSP